MAVYPPTLKSVIVEKNIHSKADVVVAFNITLEIILFIPPLSYHADEIMLISP